jgi:4-carboxymuconolactone decarboxylase
MLSVMSDHLPDVYVGFRTSFPDVAAAQDALAARVDAVGPLSAREVRLVKLGVAVGAASAGAVRSSSRKALDLGVGPDELRQAALCAITTVGFPAAIAALGWVDEVLAPGS